MSMQGAGDPIHGGGRGGNPGGGKAGARRSYALAFRIPGDASATYSILDCWHDERHFLRVISRRIALRETSYSEREFNMAAQTFRYLRDSTSRAEFDATAPALNAAFQKMLPGSISYVIGRKAEAALKNKAPGDEEPPGANVVPLRG